MDGTWHLALWTNYSSPIYLLQQRCHIQRFLGRFCVSILPSITIKIDLNVFLFCLIHLHFSSLLLRVDTENILQELKTKISVLIRAYRTMFTPHFLASTANKDSLRVTSSSSASDISSSLSRSQWSSKGRHWDASIGHWMPWHHMTRKATLIPDDERQEGIGRQSSEQIKRSCHADGF